MEKQCICVEMIPYGLNKLISYECPKHGKVTVDARPLPHREEFVVTRERRNPPKDLKTPRMNLPTPRPPLRGQPMSDRKILLLVGVLCVVAGLVIGASDAIIHAIDVWLHAPLIRADAFAAVALGFWFWMMRTWVFNRKR